MFVVVGGNQFSSSILDLDIMEWRDGPSPGSWCVDATAAQFGGTFVIVGGRDSDGIYEFDPENEEFIERPEKLNSSRRDSTAVFVKDNILNCS